MPKGKELRTMPSKKHSCSELEKGHNDLLKVKTEHGDPEELQRQIEDRSWSCTLDSVWNEQHNW